MMSYPNKRHITEYDKENKLVILCNPPVYYRVLHIDELIEAYKKYINREYVAQMLYHDVCKNCLKSFFKRMRAIYH